MSEVLRAVGEGGRLFTVEVLAVTSSDAAERFDREAQIPAGAPR